MKLIIVDNRSGRSRAFSVNGLLLGLTLAGLLGIPSVAGFTAYRMGLGEAVMVREMVSKWRQALEDQDIEVK
ncbi:MAG: hypothetical protein ACI9OF_002553, partial [Saprospiraceae bacterium]